MAAAITPNQYEAMFLLGPSAAQDQDGALTTVRSMVEKHGAQILVIKKWDERKLAYEVGGQKRGTYIICYFSSPGAAVAQIERDVRLSDGILRVLVTRADHLNPDEMAAVEPQPIQPREERNPWDRPYGEGDRGGGRRDDRPPRDDRGPRDDRAPRPPARREEQPAGEAEAKD